MTLMSKKRAIEQNAESPLHQMNWPTLVLFLFYAAFEIFFATRQDGLHSAIELSAYFWPVFAGIYAGRVAYLNLPAINSSRNTSNQLHEQTRRAFAESLAFILFGFLYELIYLFKPQGKTALFSMVCVIVVMAFIYFAITIHFFDKDGWGRSRLRLVLFLVVPVLLFVTLARVLSLGHLF